MGISYQGRDVQKQSEVGLRLEDLVSYDYSAYDSGSGEGAVEVVDRWLVADDFQYSSSIEFDKESLESYSASYFLPTVINISGAFYGIFSGSGASVSGPLTVIGTSSFYGPVNISGALRLDPTEDPGNIEPSSSFLFQSASNTNSATDLYIRQGSQFIKFNWIADTLFTSLLYGGIVTYSGSTVYISSGSGIVVDHNANTVNESAATIKYVTWPNTSFTPTYINVRQVTYLAFDSSSNLIQDYEPFNSDDYVDKIILGAIGHFDLTNVTAFQGSALTAYAQQTQTNTFIDSFGPLKLTGYGITAQPSSFKLSVAAGTSFIHGGFYDYDPTRPSNISTAAQATASIAYVYRNGSGGIFFDTNGGAFYTNVTCSLYDDNTGTPASVSNNNWTIQRVTCDPRTGKLYIYYGQNIYATLDDALTNLPTDSFTEGDTKDFTTFLGYLVVKSNTSDLSNTTDNSILTSGLFRGIGGGGGGTGGGGAGTPGGASTEIQYNNGGTFGGSPNFTFDGVSHVRVTGSLTVSGSSTFTNIGPAAFNGNTSMTGSLFVSSSNATQLQVGSNLLFVSSSGRVGLRNTVPNSDLEIYGVGSGDGTLRLTRGNNNANYVALSGGTSGAIYNINTSGVQDHIFQTGGTERMRISGSGNVGIGNTGVTNTALAITANGAGGGNFIIQGYDSSAINRFLVTATGRLQMTGTTDTGTSGTDERVRLTYTFNPTSGTREHMGIYLVQAVSQSGGANGITRGLYIQPTLTSAADYRAIENTAGNNLFNLTSGNTYVGLSANNGTARFQVRGSGATSATTALRVENTNASASIITTDDNVTYLYQYGTAANNAVFYNGSNGSGNLALIRNNTPGNNEGFSISFGRSDGTIAAPSNVQINRGLGLISFSGYHTGDYRQGAIIRAIVDLSDVSSTSMPTRLVFLTSPSGSTTPVERMRITSTGSVLIGTTTDAGFRLDVSGSARITNGLTVTGSLISPSITGSLQGTASFATTASYALTSSAAGANTTVQYNSNGNLFGSDRFTFDGTTVRINSATLLITGSSIVSGSSIITGSLQVGVPGTSAATIDTTVGTLGRGSSVSIDWPNRLLANSSLSAYTVDWENVVLNDPSNVLSIDWGSRTLSEATATFTALDYSNDGYLNSQLYYRNIIPGQVQRKLAETPASYYGGQVIQATVDVSVTDFQLVYLSSNDGTWYPLKNLAPEATRMVGICVDATGGYVLIEGDVGVSDDNSQGAYVIGADHGLPVYVGTSNGVMTTTTPTSGVIRIVGHIYYQSTTDTNWWTMKFRPSNDWYEQ